MAAAASCSHPAPGLRCAAAPRVLQRPPACWVVTPRRSFPQSNPPRPPRCLPAGTNLTRLGVVVLACFAISNPLLHFAKICNQLSLGSLKIGGFVMFALAFFLSRVLLVPVAVLKTALFDSRCAGWLAWRVGDLLGGCRCAAAGLHFPGALIKPPTVPNAGATLAMNSLPTLPHTHPERPSRAGGTSLMQWRTLAHSIGGSTPCWSGCM